MFLVLITCLIGLSRNIMIYLAIFLIGLEKIRIWSRKNLKMELWAITRVRAKNWRRNGFRSL